MRAAGAFGAMLDPVSPSSSDQSQQANLIFPARWQLDAVKPERQHCKQRLVATCRAFAQTDMDYGFAERLTIRLTVQRTVRDPECSDRYWITAIYAHFGKVTVPALIPGDHARPYSPGSRRR